MTQQSTVAVIAGMLFSGGRAKDGTSYPPTPADISVAVDCAWEIMNRVQVTAHLFSTE